MSPDSTEGESRPGPSWIGRLRRVAGRARRALRAALDGTLHPFRRRRARGRLATVEPPLKIVFVCLGNVCRSPYAEARLRERALGRGLSVDVASAGLIGPGRPPPEPARRQARSRGLETGDHRSRLASPELLADAALVVVMERRQARRLPTTRRDAVVVLGDLDPGPVRRRSIRDPWGGEDALYLEVFERIDRCVDEMVRLLEAAAGRLRDPVAAAPPREETEP